MTLPSDRCRCFGQHDDSRCPRADRCARHLALRTDPPGVYASCADRLCYSGYSFYIEGTSDDN